MASNRHVPLTIGIVAVIAAGWMVVAISGWWRYVPGALLFAFGVASVKTALFASSKEIDELTSTSPASEDTIRRFKDRL